MNSQCSLHAIGVFMALALAPLGIHPMAAATNVYATQFEAAEGYNSNLDLAGQVGWIGEGTGGSGLLSGFIAGQGQHAYLGFSPPASVSEDELVLWQPINFNPLAAGLPVVTFSVQMQIADSSNQNWDYFQWSVYNAQGDRLFTLDFDNYALGVNYFLDADNPLVPTNLLFTNEVTYTLNVVMDFASNRWSATFNGALLATNQPLTTTGKPLNLGTVAAVWLIYDPATPGDNFMVFDNYRIIAEARATPPPAAAQVRLLGRTAEGWALLRVLGEDGVRWAVDATTNFTHWTALRTNFISGAYFDFVDQTAAGFQRRFYRARFVP